MPAEAPSGRSKETLQAGYTGVNRQPSRMEKINWSTIN